MTGIEPLQDAVLIAGPTASGKSAAALELARRLGGVVVNADSMQVYSVLDVVTARPSADDLALAEHRLYGHVHPSAGYSAGHWQRDVGDLIRSGALAGKRAIFTGGTGLYFKALAGGLSDIPETDQAIRDKWRDLLAADGPAGLHRQLTELDPETAAALRPTDGQRIVRALEVLESTGRPIRHWQSLPGVPLIELASVRRIVIDPGRYVTNQRVAGRFAKMVNDGALDEVKALLDLNLDSALPAMRAIGVDELGCYLAGKMTLAGAIDRAIVATRQYAKRQRTWFRNQFGPEWERISTSDEVNWVQLLDEIRL